MKTIPVSHGAISFSLDGKHVVIDTNGFNKLNPTDLRRISKLLLNTANDLDSKYSY